MEPFNFIAIAHVGEAAINVGDRDVSIVDLFDPNIFTARQYR